MRLLMCESSGTVDIQAMYTRAISLGEMDKPGNTVMEVVVAVVVAEAVAVVVVEVRWWRWWWR